MRFFVLEHPKRAVDDALTDFVSADGTKRGAAPRCPKCGDFVGGLPRLPPMQFELETWGQRFGDLAFGAGNDVLVTDQFKEAFLSSGLTGFFRFSPAEIVKVVARRRKILTPMPNYFVAIPGVSRAAVDHQKSGMDYMIPWTCEECRIGHIMRLRRLVIEPDTWSGEDVFIPRGLPGTIVTSERFKQFCDRYSFSNCQLIAAEEYHFDFFPQVERRDATSDEE